MKEEELDSGHVAVRYDLACCLLRSGRKADAEKILPELEEAAPVLAAALRQLLDSEVADPGQLPIIIELQSYPVEAEQSDAPLSVQTNSAFPDFEVA